MPSNTAALTRGIPLRACAALIGALACAGAQSSILTLDAYSVPAPSAQKSEALDSGEARERHALAAQAAYRIALDASEAVAAARAHPQRNQVGVHLSAVHHIDGDDLEWFASYDEGGARIATIAIESPGALRLRLHLRASLPEGTRIHGYDASAAHARWTLQGDDLEKLRSPWWLPPTLGEIGHVEIEVPSEEATRDVVLRTTKVSHTFTAMPLASAPQPQGGRVAQRDDNAMFSEATPKQTDPGRFTPDWPDPLSPVTPCNRNARCSTDPKIAKLIDSAIYITGQGEEYGFWCSATLVNSAGATTHAGERLTPPPPYVFTAAHCVSNQRQADTLSVAYFHATERCEDRPRSRDPYELHTGGATLLASGGWRPGEQVDGRDWTLLLLHSEVPPGAVYAGWDATPRLKAFFSGENVSVDVLHLSLGWPDHGPFFGTKIASGNARWDLVDEGEEPYDMEMRFLSGSTYPGASGSGVFHDGRFIGVHYGGAPGDYCPSGGGAAPLEYFFPQVAQWLTGPREHLYRVHTFPRFSDSGTLAQGFLRISNESDENIRVDVAAIDDADTRHEAGHIFIRARGASAFRSDSLENGNDARHPHLVGIGAPRGAWWRLELRSKAELDVRAYARVPGGFVTSLNGRADEVEGEDNAWHVAFFNPASNLSVRSVLRLVNDSEEDAEITIDAIDAQGEPGTEQLTLTLAAGHARNLTSQEMEAGADDAARFTGSLGDGHGKWRLTVRSTAELTVQSLIRSATTGHITDVTH